MYKVCQPPTEVGAARAIEGKGEGRWSGSMWCRSAEPIPRGFPPCHAHRRRSSGSRPGSPRLSDTCSPSCGSGCPARRA
eukprot:scaffold702_cov119-Isochrysis_galbana.AAC.10